MTQLETVVLNHHHPFCVLVFSDYFCSGTNTGCSPGPAVPGCLLEPPYSPHTLIQVFPPRQSLLLCVVSKCNYNKDTENAAALQAHTCKPSGSEVPGCTHPESDGLGAFIQVFVLVLWCRQFSARDLLLTGLFVSWSVFGAPIFSSWRSQ